MPQTTNPRRPSGGLFGATRSDTNPSERLNFTFEVAEGYDSQLPVERGVAVVGGSLSSAGFLTQFGASSAFAHRGRSLQFAASASTAFKYYQELDRLDALSHGAAVGIGVHLPTGGRFEINEALAYSPSYLYQLFPQAESPALGASIALNPDYRIEQTDTYSSLTRADFVLGSPRETLLTTSAEYEITNYENQTTALAGLKRSTVGTIISRAVSQNWSLVGGYKYRTGEVGFSGPSHEHETPIGVEYSSRLSASRRLKIRVNVAPAWLRFAPEPLESAIFETGSAYRYRLQGNGSLSYPFRLNWSTDLTYERSVQYVMGLNEPLLADSVRIGLTGLVSRRLDLKGGLGYADAVSAQSGSREHLDLYTAGVKFRYALKRSVAVYSEYLYYYYDQRGLHQLAPGLPSVFEQHGVRAGMVFFAEALGGQQRR